MKRTEIQLGVVYAHHGPLAYGQIPNNRPARIRFTSLNPNARMMQVYEVNESGRGSHQVREYITFSHVLIPRSSTRALEAGMNPGDQYEQVEEYRHPKGGLPAEITVNGVDWTPAVFAPAGVHMTWDEYQEKERNIVEVRRQRELNQAPAAYRRDLQSMLRNALLANIPAQTVQDDVNNEIRRSYGQG